MSLHNISRLQAAENVTLTVSSRFWVKTSYGCLHTHGNNGDHCQVFVFLSHDKY